MKKQLSILSLCLIFCWSLGAHAEDEDNLELTAIADEAAPTAVPSAVEASEETVIPAEESVEIQDTSADLSVESGEDF